MLYLWAKGALEGALQELAEYDPDEIDGLQSFDEISEDEEEEGDEID